MGATCASPLWMGAGLAQPASAARAGKNKKTGKNGERKREAERDEVGREVGAVLKDMAHSLRRGPGVQAWLSLPAGRLTS
jgi:hypothetical protein